MYKPQDITINHLQLQGDKNAVQSVLFDFEHHQWSRYSDDKWLFVRNLSINGKQQEISQKAGDALQWAYHSAVSGSASHAATANVVYFNSLPELLSFLLRDLIQDKILQKWYWQQWYYLARDSKSNGVARLLWQNTESLSAIVTALIKVDLLVEVWQKLSHQSAGTLIEQLEQTLPMDTMQVKPSRLSEAETALMLEQAIEQQYNFIKPKLRAWAKALKGISNLDSRYQLALQLIGMEYFPRIYQGHSLLMKQALTQLIESSGKGYKINRHGNVNAKLSDDNKALAQPNNRPGPVKPQLESSLVLQKQGDGENRVKQIPLPDAQLEAAQSKESEKSSAQISPLSSSDHSDQTGQSKDEFAEVVATAAELDKALDESGTEEAFSQDLEIPFFYTDFGGFFFLINALNHEQAQAILAKGQEAYSAWLCLFDLARRLSVDLDEPLLAFIAEQSGYDRVDDLLELPPLAVIDELEALLKQHYQEQNLWHQALIRVRAKVLVSSSHIDCYYSLNDVRLDIRLAGLDFNPHWVPWLGRVVTFHYE